MQDRQRLVIEAAKSYCETLGYERPLKVVFREHDIEGFPLGIHVAQADLIDKEIVELPEWELRVSPKLLAEATEPHILNRLALALLALSPRERKRHRVWISILVSIPIAACLVVIYLAVRFGWLMLLALPLSLLLIYIEVPLLYPLMTARTRKALEAIELTGDAITPLSIVRKRVDDPATSGSLRVRLHTLSDRAYLRRLQREAAKRGYRTAIEGEQD